MIDSHCHLYDPAFEPDCDDVLTRAFSAGITDIIISGTDIDRNEKALSLCRKIRSERLSGKPVPQTYATLGLSPFLAVSASDDVINATLDHLEGLLKTHDPAVIGIGESGMDYFYHKDEAERLRQRNVFERVIGIAAENDLPLVIHGRDAESDCLDMILSGGLRKAVFHSYGGSPETMRRILDSGYFISLSTLVCTSSRHKKLAGMVDPDRLFLETDSPYLSPRKMKGFPRNEPSFATDSLRKVASLLSMTTEELTELTIRNVRKFYGI